MSERTVKRWSKRIVVTTIAVVSLLGWHAALVNHTQNVQLRKDITTSKQQNNNFKKSLKDLNLQLQNVKTKVEEGSKKQEQLQQDVSDIKESRANLQRERIALESNKASIPKPPNVTTESNWHYDCQSQETAVKQAVFDLGLGGDWEYISYIFGHESCMDPGRLNSEGCGGLGQACPRSKLGCGANDIHCQVRFFDSYAKQRYGSWSLAHVFWLANRWW